MTEDELIICKTCGSSNIKSKFCTNCGAMLGASELEEAIDYYNRLTEIKDLTEKLRAKIILDRLTIQAEKALLTFRENFAKIYRHYTIKKEYLPIKIAKDESYETSSNMTHCRICGNIVPAANFCKECGIVLFATPIVELDSILNGMKTIVDNFKNFVDIAKDSLKTDEIEDCETTSTLLNQFSSRVIASKNVYIGVMAGKQPDEIPITSETGSLLEKTLVEKQPIELAQQPRVWSKLEKNLLNYWFFYLAILLFSLGITLTIYFVVVELNSVVNQIITIYSIGGGIVIIGEIVAILSRWNQKKKVLIEKEELLEPGDLRGLGDLRSEIKQKRNLPIPQFASIIVFIGFIVLYVGGIVGIGGANNKALFMYLSFGIAIASIVLGVLNKSEMLTLTGFIPIPIFAAIDYLWDSYPPVMNGLTSLFVFIILFILATIVAIFFNKWWGALFTMSITPFILCIPKVASHVALEFLPLILIPTMILLVIRFSKGKIPITHKRILVFLSLILPSISLIVLTHPFITSVIPESPWATIYPFEIFLSGMVILGIGFYYRFIQEEHLEMKMNLDVFWILGLIFTGLFSIFLLAFNYSSGFNYITTTLFFGLFFIFGILQVITPMKKYSTLAGKILTFSFAELEIILMLSLSRPTNIMETSFYFILSISFALIAILSSIIPKAFVDSKVMYLIWSIISGINIVILGLLDRINTWFAFGGLILILATAAMANLPFIATKRSNWRINSLSAMGITLIVLVTFLVIDSLSLFKYQSLVMLLIFILINIPAFFEWKTKEVQTVE
ncbi:MAG: hypothetical protein JXA54_05055 [Candidatus Heimdallarchaeota archaeon]|nr:hypothetical protein [Candidatus Heimdallarchaeota archaeon]